MNAYFTASFAGKKKFEKRYRAIVAHLTSRGYSVIADHILRDTELDVKLASRDERLKFHRKLEGWIKTSDVMIAETSFPSISVGYEISLAIHLSKPVLILYSIGDPPSLLGHHHDDKIVCERYTDETLSGVIDQFLTYTEGKSDTRFTFFITPAIASYLETVSRRQKLPKSVYLRKLIEEDMREKGR